MSVINWLFEAKLHIGHQTILWREVIGNLIGLASAVGGMRRRVWAWPVGIAGNVLLFTVFLGVAFDNPQHSTLWGQAARQVFFVAVSVYGWSRWAQNRRAAAAGAGATAAATPAVQPRWASARERWSYLGIGAGAVAVGFPVFMAIGAGWPAPGWYYLADSWIFVGSVLATYAMARGWVDFWLCWIAVDVVGVPELLRFHYYPSAVLYGVYGVFVAWGFFVWRRHVNRPPADRRPGRVATGAAASA